MLKTEFDSKKISSLPGVYQMLDTNHKVLYIGKAKNLNKRLKSYFQKNLAAKTSSLMAKTKRLETIITDTEAEALILENNLIKKHKPRYNILLRDDKSYPYIFISNDKYPQLRFHRGSKTGPGEYFGPFAGAYAVRETLKLIQKIFKIRQCDNSFFNNRSRPCLNFQINRCSAPCVNNISENDYAQDIKHSKMFLSGKSDSISKQLKKKMHAAAGKREYEDAARYRDQIKYIREIQDQQLVSGNRQNLDVVALELAKNIAVVQVFVFRGGNNLGNRSLFLKNINQEQQAEALSAFISQHYLDKFVPDEIIVSHKPAEIDWLKTTLSQQSGKKIKISFNVRKERARWLKLARKNAKMALNSRLNLNAGALKRLEALQDALTLDSNIITLECFDISHSAGEATVGSCVVFNNGLPAKQLYRKYNIKSTNKGDDYAAMREVLNRRYARILKQDAKLPDLIIIDGGKGQLAIAEEVLTELQIDSVILLGIAKGEGRKPKFDTIYLSPENQKVKLGSNSLALHFIQQIRDEAHRFAIGSHRAARARTRNKSSLENIPGIGAKRRKKLINHFGGLKKISAASAQQLARVNGISNKQAEKIYNFLHE